MTTFTQWVAIRKVRTYIPPVTGSMCWQILRPNPVYIGVALIYISIFSGVSPLTLPQCLSYGVNVGHQEGDSFL